VLSSSAPRRGFPESLPGGPNSAFWAQYEIVKEIGRGGWAWSYEANDRSVERRCGQKMRDEIRIESHEPRLRHEPKLVALRIQLVESSDREDADDVTRFEYVDGRTLHD